MVFVEYKYGSWKKEIRNLLRKRLSLKNNIRYHKMKAKKFEEELPKIEEELHKFLVKAGNKI